MKKFSHTLFIAIALLISSCSSYSSYHLSPNEVVEAVVADNKLLQDISTLDDSVRQLRQEVMFMAVMGLIEEKNFLQIRKSLLAADYYVAKSWAAALEKNKDAQMLYQMGADELKRAIDATVSSVDKKNSI